MFEQRSRAEWIERGLLALRTAYERSRRYVRDHQFVLLSLGLIAVTAFGARFLAIVRFPGPSGADYGNYLTNLHAFLGQDVTGDGLGYPTVFLVYLWLVTSAFGELQGLQISGPLLAALLCLPSYVLLRTFVDTRLALVGAGMLTFAESVSELIGWGGNPNLLGMAFGTLFFAFLARWMIHGRRRDLLAGAVSFGLLAGSHQISFAYFGSATLVALTILAFRGREARRLLRRGAKGLGAGIATSLPFLPFYLSVNEASSYLISAQSIVLTVNDVAFIIAWLFRESLAIWILFFLLAVLGVYRLRGRDPVAFSVGIALLGTPFLLAATVMVLHPVRPLYFLFLGIVLGAMLFLRDGWKERIARATPRPDRADGVIVATVLVLAFALVLVTTAHNRMVQAGNWYIVMTDEVLDGLEWLRDHTPADAAVATSGPVKYGAEDPVGCVWGWWVEGYAHRRSLCTGDLQTLAWNAQIRRSADANRAFLGVVSVENGLLQLGDFAPFGSRGNPLIYGEFGRGYEPLVFFNDARVDISWRDSGGQVRFDRPFYLPTRETSKAIDADRARLEFRAEGQGLLVVRTVESSRDSGTVWVNYTFEAAGTLDRVDISVFGTSRSRINNFDFTTDELTLGGELGFRDAVGGRVRIVDGATRLVGTLPMTNLQAELSEYRFEFAPTAGTFRSSFAVDVGYHVTAVPGPVVSYAAREIFDAHGVGYLLIDRTKVREMEWLTNDRNGYRIAYRNFAVAVFEVIQ